MKKQITDLDCLKYWQVRLDYLVKNPPNTKEILERLRESLKSLKDRHASELHFALHGKMPETQYEMDNMSMDMFWSGKEAARLQAVIVKKESEIAGWEVYDFEADKAHMESMIKFYSDRIDALASV